MALPSRIKTKPSHFTLDHTPELGTNRFAGMGIGAKGAKMSAGAGANPPGLAVLLGFRTSTYLLLVPEKK